MKVLASLILFATLTSLVRAQSQDSLVIGPGDQVHVQVFDVPELEQKSRVSDSGELTLHLGGAVKVAGLTAPEAAKVVEAALRDGHFVLNPKVLVSIDDFASSKVAILGEVHSPGKYAITSARSIIDVLSLAGGLTDLADRKVTIQRRGTTERVEYFVSNTANSALDGAVQVFPGDTVIVPRAGVVYALGDVGHPGGYPMSTNDSTMSVLQLISMAGGTAHSAVPSHTRLIRKQGTGYVEIPVQLSKMAKGKQPDMSLQPGDIIYVPFSYLRNFGTNGSAIIASAANAVVYRF